jgi:hypothetical protein
MQWIFINNLKVIYNYKAPKDIKILLILKYKKIMLIMNKIKKNNFIIYKINNKFKI